MIVRVAIDLALDRLFTYEVPQTLQKKLAIGQLLSVPFGHREARGFAIEIGGEEKNASYALKPINAIIDETPFFSKELITLVRKVADYTASPLESVLKAALPASVLKRNVRPRELMYIEMALTPYKVELTKHQRWLYNQIVRLGGGWMTSLCKELKTTPATIKELGRRGLVKVAVKARRRDPLAFKKILPTKPLPLNPEQAKALSDILAKDKGTVLLHGITGSGKTEVYLQAIAKILAEDGGAIVMVPEIALTPQTVQRFASRFGDKVAVLHSALSDGERYDEWHRIRAGSARVVVGPRSAVFAPIKNLKLIVVDEEHETSYKQEDNPRYHARDVAVLRGAVEGIRVVLGSATPSLESYLNAKKGKYELSMMKNRAGLGQLPKVHLVEMQGGEIFSRELLDAIHVRLDRAEQTILFLNRRGYSTSMTCDGCGKVMECEECSIAYTYHKADSCLRCHVCGGWRELPQECPNCRGKSFTYKGIGTQRAEAALTKCFPRAKILRMDADSTSRKHSHDEILSAFRRGEAQILLGTQMIAKGLDFPNVTLVGVLNADSSLNMPDFRASERTFQLLAQVSGRSGRAELPGEVIIQSHNPSAPAITKAASANYEAFAEGELKERKIGYFPPFCHLAIINLKSKDMQEVADWAEMYAKSLQKCVGLTVSEAMPSALEKAEGYYRWQIVVRAKLASEIARAWRWIVEKRPPKKSLKLAIDIDSLNVL